MKWVDCLRLIALQHVFLHETLNGLKAICLLLFQSVKILLAARQVARLPEKRIFLSSQQLKKQVLKESSYRVVAQAMQEFIPHIHRH